MKATATNAAARNTTWASATGAFGGEETDLGTVYDGKTISTLALSKALKLGAISFVTALWKVSLLVLLVLGFFYNKYQEKIRQWL